MEKLTKELQQKLFNVESKKIELSRYLESGLINEEDIINLMKKDTNYGLRIFKGSNNPKKAMLKNIFNCPFLLCDQKQLSDNVKMLLPYLLNTRYSVEKDNLKIYLEQGFIDEREYIEELEKLTFFYYETSNDGKSILETGHVVFAKEQIKAL